MIDLGSGFGVRGSWKERNDGLVHRDQADQGRGRANESVGISIHSIEVYRYYKHGNRAHILTLVQVHSSRRTPKKWPDALLLRSLLYV
jgi:hypothetical protein